MACDPVGQCRAQSLYVLLVVRQDVGEARLRRLARASFVQNPVSGAIPGRDSHRGIVRQEVDLVLDVVAERSREDALAKEFVTVVTDQILTTWVVEARGDRFDQPETLVGFSQEENATVRTESLVPCP